MRAWHTAGVKPPRRHADAHPATSTPLVLLQTITTQWSKAARGAPTAARRRGVPEALLVPAALPSTTEMAVICHEVRYGERDGFQMPEFSTVQRDVLSGTLHAHNLNISLDGEVLRVDLAWTWGAPMRRPVRGIMSAVLGEWGRVCFNYRTSSGYAARWVYGQVIANIGLFVRPEPAIFRTTQPSKTYTNMADLMT